MRPFSLAAILILCSIPLASACSSEPSASSSTTGTGGSSGTGGSGGEGGATGPCPATEVACSDQAIQKMNLQTDIAPGKVDNMPDGSGFISTIDATAGGFGNPDPDSYVHARFTDKGLEKVDISDQDSLDSLDWDIAFRRYIIRINSGSSGPSCVVAARIPGMATFDDVAAIPDMPVYKADDYFTETCDFIPDGSGMEDSPATALSSFYNYTGCVAMTGHVYIVQLRDGRHLKLSVLSYYAESTQTECNACPMDCFSITPTGAATLRVRWAFLP